MKVYVSELPKSCRDCPCMESDGYGFYTCLLYYKKHEMLLDCEDYKDSRPNECLLQSLAEHDKQVRKEVCEDVGKHITKKDKKLEKSNYSDSFVSGFHCCYCDVKHILDQIQGE